MTQDFSTYAMSTPGEYTITLGNLIDMGYDTDEKLHLSADYYPIYDENHRRKLNEKIVASGDRTGNRSTVHLLSGHDHGRDHALFQ